MGPIFNVNSYAFVHIDFNKSSDIIKQIVLSVRPLYPEPEKRRKPFTVFDKILMCAPNSGQLLDSSHMSVYVHVCVDELNSIVVVPCVHWLMLNFDQSYFSIYYSVCSRMRHMECTAAFHPSMRSVFDWFGNWCANMFELLRTKKMYSMLFEISGDHRTTLWHYRFTWHRIFYVLMGPPNQIIKENI